MCKLQSWVKRNTNRREKLAKKQRSLSPYLWAVYIPVTFRQSCQSGRDCQQSESCETSRRSHLKTIYKRSWEYLRRVVPYDLRWNKVNPCRCLEVRSALQCRGNEACSAIWPGSNDSFIPWHFADEMRRLDNDFNWWSERFVAHCTLISPALIKHMIKKNDISFFKCVVCLTTSKLS